MKVDRGMARRIGWTAICCCTFLLFSGLAATGESSAADKSDGKELKLVRAVRPWEFISALGTRGALLGNESGNFEAWVYPLKILRNFQLRFKVEDQVIEGKAIARSLTVRPESTTITYVWDTFTVRETLFVPVREPGAVVQLEIDTSQPLQIEAAFERDFQLEWPGAMGGTDIEWNANMHAFAMTENQQKFSAWIGSPQATEFRQEYVTNYTASKENSFGFGLIAPGKSTKLIVMAASFDGLPPADVTYRKLSTTYPQLLADAAAYYQDYLKNHVVLELPDAALQKAYEWAQVSVLQGLVTNPFLGTGLVAGYRVSGEDQRPGYAWFFGRDALWTSLGLDAEGDFSTTRTALDFLSKYQRADGKVTHEISQGATFVPWFQGMPYAYASADATPLFIVAMNDYVQHSGDIAFAADKWSNLWRAYQFIVSTYDKGGLPRNDGVGHGWVEGGPLLPVKSELYQTGVVVEALRSLANIAKLLDKEDINASLTAEFLREQLLLNQAFWIDDKQRYAFAVDNSGRRVDTPSVLATVPMWFGLLDDNQARSMIAQLALPDIQTTWGMRIIPASNPKYQAAGYHAGTVWPLFTGWASVGEYRYHQALPAYANLRANALLTFDGSLGHVAEVLSGDYYQTLAAASPHQIWSSAMVISPILIGLFGLETNALTNHVSFSPHVPADWTAFAIEHVQAGSCLLDFRYHKTVERMTLEISQSAGNNCTVDFAPALSLRAQVSEVELNSHATPFHILENDSDQHVSVHMSIAEPSETLVIRLKNDFGLIQNSASPSLGSTNQGMRVVSESWSTDREKLTLDTASALDGTYELGVWNPSQITTVDGAELVRLEGHDAVLRITIPPGQKSPDLHQTVVLHFAGAARTKKNTESPEPSVKGTPNVH
jgi:glycogen debranching enzyme